MGHSGIRLEDVFWLRPSRTDRVVWCEMRTYHDDALFAQWSAGKGEPSPDAPVVLRQMKGSRWPDMLGNTRLLPVVSERFVDVLTQADLTGWDTYPVHVQTKKGEPAPGGYLGFAITSAAGPRDVAQGIVEDGPVIIDGTPVFQMNGLYFDTSRWRGTDVFSLADTQHVLVTRRARDVLEAATPRLTGLRFTPVLEVRI